ncbi:hypothetical protein GCM10027047_28700 [Rhodococcus aerolatus]
MIYLDPSALVALTVLDDRGRALARWLNAGPGRAAVTSVLSDVEVPALLRETHADALPHLPRTLAAVSRCVLSDTVRHLAGVLGSHPDTRLGPTVAVHVATALVVLGRDAEAFVTHDPVVARAAAARGLRVRP